MPTLVMPDLCSVQREDRWLMVTAGKSGAKLHEEAVAVEMHDIDILNNRIDLANDF